ncbi:heavy-metal-associated domain-containing protein [uncultured Alistipes sp.]|uniref:heavy-metal-associated domain-containing protein n=1 Tax=uncultured Alistipes sp. TaxID=538949 RepID=UPI0025D50BE2|nr:heavy-metal-associated domain-containing protein [uncultured Alistipes sp.]
MKKFLICCLMAATLFGMEAFADNKNKTTRTVVFTSDIDCDHCAKKILDNVPVLGKGVEDVQVDVPTKRITVVYNPSKTDEATLVKGFAKLKVKAEPVREEKKK